MKTFLVTLAMFEIAFSVSAQTSINPDLRNTKWKGHIEIPQTLDIILEFRYDSLIVTSVEGLELGVMFFFQAKDTIRIRKLSGQGPCNNTTEGIYILKWTDSDDTLLFYPISDNCKQRSVSISAPVAYSRVKD